jgi:hypothetical protein
VIPFLPEEVERTVDSLRRALQITAPLEPGRAKKLVPSQSDEHADALRSDGVQVDG